MPSVRPSQITPLPNHHALGLVNCAKTTKENGGLGCSYEE